MTLQIVQEIYANKTELSVVAATKKAPMGETLVASGRSGAEAISILNRKACKAGLAGRDYQIIGGISGVFAPEKKAPKKIKTTPANLLEEWGAAPGQAHR